ncbi:type II toxin-antitoxin system VapC family toxin [Cronbergia sp. UHCC 0137]|uniref:type II toxin-antitoxin system VapC family toxin n=1 Tax=Cronbergia sp. UHCC 0137 TaxID=3110239 RepID=UPI002B1F7EB6|nr:type II toxin-antitoxin system VapC family toxin [Cronbergia sp. UHCC 0137]MEA5617503.1 type II toxin-antitoxin system VapC family toxin [Cronbergia sp. UHCC 0137]
MIILDTHIWFWWNQDSPRLTESQKELIENSRQDGIGISSISLIEISRLVDRGRLILPKPLNEWFSIALAEEGVLLIPITPDIAIESYSLPGEFHKDPADRIIVSTARVYDCPLMTIDGNILTYSHVHLISVE